MSTIDNSTSEITSSTSKSALTEAAPCPISADAPTPLDLSDTDVSSCDRDDFAKVSLAGIRSGNTTYGRGKFKDKSGKNYFERRGFIFGPEADLSESQLTGTAAQYILLEGKNLEKLDFSNSTLAYIDLYGTTLDEAKLNGAILKNIDARNTALKRADLSGCTINQVSYLNLKEAILKDFDLSQGNTNYLKTDNERSTSNKFDINLKGGNFSEKIFTEPEQSVLKNIDLTEGIFENAKLDNVDLTGASLYKAKLNGATLDGTKLNGAVLVGATNVVLKGAELEGFNFEQKKDSKQLDLQEIDLRGANFSDISFENIKNSELFLNLKLNDIDFTDADISKLNLGDTTDLRGAILKDATMGVSQNINLIGANFNELDGNKFNKSFFKDKDLSETQFQNARFSNHNFSGATLTGADFTDAVMDGVILNGAIGANLSGTKLNKFDLAQEGFSRQETNLTEADFSGTNKKPFKNHTNEIKESLFDGINLQGANFKDLTLKDISFAGADLEDAIFENTTLHNPILNKDNSANTEEDSEKGLNESNDIDPNNNSSEEQSKAININLSGAILEDFDFDQGVNLGSSFSNTTFKSTRNNEKINSIDIFTGANFTNAIFRKGFNLQGLNLTGATFNSTDFNQVSLRDVKLADVNLFNNSNLDLTGANLQNFDLNQISELHTKLDIEDLFQEIRTPVQESASNNSDVVGIAITSNNTDPDDGYWTYSVDSGKNWLLLPTNLSEENALFLDEQAQFRVVEYNHNRTITNKLKAKAIRPESGKFEYVPEFQRKDNDPFGFEIDGSFASPSFADIDSDGDLDAFIGNRNGKTVYFENTGQAGEPKFIRIGNNPFGIENVPKDLYGCGRAAPAFVDIDNDGNLDVFIGNCAGDTIYYENTSKVGEPKFKEKGTNRFGLEDVGLLAMPAFADIDEDGDLDAFIGNYEGNTVYFENTGKASEPKFIRIGNNPFGLIKVAGSDSDMNGNGFAAPAFADVDEDGDLDAFIGNREGNTTYYENTGKADEEKFARIGNNRFGLKGVFMDALPAFADIDKDGDLDAFIGEWGGKTIYSENIAQTRLDLTKSGAQHNFTTDQEYSLSGEYISSTNDIPRNSLKEVDLTGENFADKNVDQELVRDNYPKEILKGYNLHGSNFTDANLTGIDLSNTDLANAVLKNAILNGTKLENAVNVNLSGARLNGFNFNQDNLNLLDEYSETDFTGIDFQKINNKTIFVGSTFNQSIFTNAKLDGHNLRDTSFTNIENLEAITFEKAKLKRAQFNGTGTLNLQGADLRGFDLNQESLAENGTIRLTQKLIDVNLKGENISAYGKPEILKGFDLTETNLKNSTLDDLNLSNTTLYGVSFDGASLSRTTLSGATDVNLSGAKLNDFDFNQANLDIVGNFYQTKFGNNNLEEITNKNFFENQEFNESILKDASFNGHNLRNSKFINIDNLNTISFGKSILNGVVKRTRLKGAQFNGTGTLNLQGADLREFNLNQASLANGEISLNNKLSDVNLQGEDFSAYGKPEILQGFDLSESILIGTTFDGLDLSQTKLKGAQLQGASFKDTILKNTNFSNATDFNLNGADIRSLSILKFIPVETEINGVDFNELPSEHGAIDPNILKGRKFVNCNFEGVNMKGFDLSNTVFTDSDFKETDFEGSKLDQAKFNNPRNLDLSKANLQKFDFSQAGLDIKDINFKEAKIQDNTTLQKLNLKKINFEGAKLDGANLAGADLTKTNLTSASLSDAIFADDQGYRAEFNNTNLDGATVNTLEGAILSGLVAPEAFYKGLNLKNVEFAGNKSLVGANLTGSDLTDANLSDTNLSEAKFKNTTLNGTNFTNATLTDTQFINSDLSNAILNSLKGSDLSKIDASSIFGRSLDLSDVNLEGQDLTGIDLTNEKLSNANLNRTKLINTIARNTDLNGASFEDAILDNTILETNKLSSLAYADLRNFDLKAIEDRIQNGEIALTGVNLKGKRINNIDLTNAELNEAQFQRSRLNDVTLSGSNLHQADFTDAWIMDSVFEEEADLNQAVLDKTEIRFSRFNDAKLISASLKGADIYRGRFDHANLEGADLHKAGFENLGLRGATLDQAVLYKTVFDNVELEQATFTDSIWDQTRINRAHDLSLKGADLSQFNLSKLDKKYQNFDAIKLRDNSYINIDLDGYQMKGADLSNATFNEGTMIGTNFSALLVNREDPDGDESSYTTQTSDFSKSTFKDVDLTNAKLKDANLKKASFEDVTFTKTIFQGASLKNTTFINPIDLNLRSADLREFDISQLDLRSTSLRKTDLRNQDFTGFDFHGGRSVPIRYGNSEYELISAGSWQEASKVAKEQGGHLIVVNSNAELNVVAELLQDESTEENTAIDAWIGYSQPTQDAAWQWETNSQNALQLVADISRQSAKSRAQFSILQASSIAAAQQSATNQGGQLASTLHAIPLDLLAANTKYWTNYSHAPFDDDWTINRKELSGSEKSLLNQSISNGLKIDVSDNDFDYVGVDGRNWYFANKNAKAIGGELTSRTNFSINEINEITGETNPTVVWIGLNKDHSTNDWKWSGRPGPSPIPWKSGQPTGGDQYFGALKLEANAYQVHDIAFVSAGASGIAEIPIYRNGYYGILQKNNNNQLTLTSEPSGHYQGVLEIQKGGPAYAAIRPAPDTGTGTEAADLFPTLFSSTKNDFALRLDGSGDYAETAENISELNITGDITVEATIKMNQRSNDWVRLVGKSSSGSDRTYGLWLATDGRILFQSYGFSDFNLFTDYIVPVGDQVHIAATRSASTGQVRIYVDGELSAEGATSNVYPNPSNGPLRIGYAGFHTHFNGDIQDVSVWNIARSQSDIQANQVVGNESGLVAYYPVLSADGNTLENQSPVSGLTANLKGDAEKVKTQTLQTTSVGIALVGNTTTANGEDWQYSVDGGINWTSIPSDLSEINALYLNQNAQLRVIKAHDDDNDNTALGDGLIAKAVFEFPTDPEFKDPTSNHFGLEDVGVDAKPAFADIDKDGDLDAFTGNDLGNTTYFENTSNPPQLVPGMLYDFSNEDEWSVVYATGSYGDTPYDESTFNESFRATPNHIVKRECDGCLPGYEEIYYKRLTHVDKFNVGYVLVDTWSKQTSDGLPNILGQDFNIYSTYEDALAGTNAWSSCNYDDAGIGFPRDCGDNGLIGGQWNSLTRGGKRNIRFSTEPANAADFELSDESGSIESAIDPIDPIDPNLQDIVDTKIVFDGDSINHAIIERPLDDADYEIDLKGANLTGTILSGANLSYANLNNAQLKNVDFTDTILRGAKMRNTTDLDLTRADLRGFDITQVDLKNTSLEHVDLSGENLTGLNLSEAKLKGANLQNAILINANLTGIDLRNADLRGAKLNGAILKNARLSEAKGVNLQGTNLEGFDMGQVELAGQDLSNTNLEGQTISNTSLTKTNLTNANLKNATLNNVGLNSAILTGAELEGATLNDVTLDGVADLDLEGSRLTGDPEALQTVSLDQIDLTQSTLQEKNFDGLNLQGLDFSGVDLTGSTFIGTRLQGAIFDRANLTNVDFTDATLKNVSIENIQLDNGKKLLLDDADLKNFDLAQLDELGHDQFSLIGADLSGLDFNNLSDQHLKDLNFNETTLTGASFNGTTLEGNKFIGSDLSETTFKDATINNAIFNNATGDYLTNFRNATFTNATFKNSTFDQSNFSKTKFNGTLIVKGNVFDNSNFNQSDLSPSLANTSDWFNITCPNGSNNQNNLFACPST